LLHLVGWPGAAVVQVMQRRDDSGRAGLPDMGKLDRIVGSEPAPGLLHVRTFLETSAECAAATPSLRKVSRCAEARPVSVSRWTLPLAKPARSKTVLAVSPAGRARAATLASKVSSGSVKCPAGSLEPRSS